MWWEGRFTHTETTGRTITFQTYDRFVEQWEHEWDSHHLMDVAGRLNYITYMPCQTWSHTAKIELLTVPPHLRSQNLHP
jgi:hypothetical protein